VVGGPWQFSLSGPYDEFPDVIVCIKLRLRWFTTFSFVLCGSRECAYSTAHPVSCEKIVFDTNPRSRVSNANYSVGHMRTYKVTQGSHYDADATIAVPELNLDRIYCERYHKF